MVSSLCERVLKLNSAVAYVAVLDSSNTLLEFASRNGPPTKIPEQIVREFVSIAPLVILGSVGRLQESCGDTRSVVIRYQNSLTIIYQRKLNFVVVLFDSDVDQRAVEEIGEEVEQIE